ncbi:MAG: hypothetical protein CBC13_10655 [Planctomycetia bacterium TMED53]|nr:MAG: hypothetical protein CBC13_10655 [Planctomycetia bacterium TMED53]
MSTALTAALIAVAGFFALGPEVSALDRSVTPRGPLASEEDRLVQLFEGAAPTVVNVRAQQQVNQLFGGEAFQRIAGTGTGFIWDLDGHVVTNYHVVARGSGGVSVAFSDGTTSPAKIVGYSRAKDLAVLKVEEIPEGLELIPVGTSDDLRVGQFVHAIGNPFGLDQSLSRGVISALGREIQSLQGTTIHDVIQTDAAVNPGNSGGPLLDSQGRLIGVNTAIISPTGAHAGISFAIPVDTVTRTVPDLIEHGEVQRPILGFVPYTGSGASRFKGVVIVEVDGPLAEKGVLGVDEGSVRDQIVAVDGRPTPSLGELLSLLEGYRAGVEVEVTLERDGEERKIRTTLLPPPS